MKITLQKQPTADTCVSACLAMLTGAQVSDVIDEFHDDFTNVKTSPVVYLKDKLKDNPTTFAYSPKCYPVSPLEPNKIYLLTVPSCNERNLFHSVVVDTREVNDLPSAICYDPSQGCIYKTAMEYDGEPGTTQLRTWFIDVIIDTGGF